MELTGKCREDFLKWYFENHLKEDKYCKVKDVEQFFESVKAIFQNTLIIDWFDSVGIYISIEPYINLFDNSNFYFCFTIIDYIHYSKITSYKTRQEATTEAIKKANEIYNKL